MERADGGGLIAALPTIRRLLVLGPLLPARPARRFRSRVSPSAPARAPPQSERRASAVRSSKDRTALFHAQNGTSRSSGGAAPCDSGRIWRPAQPSDRGPAPNAIAALRRSDSRRSRRGPPRRADGHPHDPRFARLRRTCHSGAGRNPLAGPTHNPGFPPTPRGNDNPSRPRSLHARAHVIPAKAGIHRQARRTPLDSR